MGSNVLIGAGCKILGPVTIGDNVRLGAGSVVLKSIPSNSTAIGMPAQVVRRYGMPVRPSDDLDQQDFPTLCSGSLNSSLAACSAWKRAPAGMRLPDRRKKRLSVSFKPSFYSRAAKHCVWFDKCPLYLIIY